MTLPLNSILENRYRIENKLGEGGFGAVYQAVDSRLNVHCAVKESLHVTEEATRQFKREAEMLAKLRHPNLARVTDYFIIPNQGQYLVMDFVDGIDLHTALTNYGKALPLADTLRWTLQICDALIYIHGQNPPIIHRDIKPANIRITPQNNAVLVDFGLAKALEANAKTSTGARGLTPIFAAPEQYGMGGTDAQSDVYSLGVTLYCMLTNRVPADSVDIMVGNAEPPPPAKAINKDVSDTISEAIQRSMQIRRTERCKSVSDFKSLLLNFQKLPAQISNPTNVYTSKVSKIKLSARENTIVLSNGMEFMHIPAGKFIMGSSSGGGGDEKPEHTVNIPYDYWMARFPITNEQYYEYAKEKKFSHPVPDWQKKPTHPVENITLVRAIGYSQWLNTLFEKELQAGASICLPTEAEWEKSARGTDRRKYPWGDQFDLDLCNSEENGHGGTTPVDLYTPNGDSPYGCADMSGNVWEWTHSRYAPYPYDPKDGREDEQITWNDSRILRGGACDCGKGWIRCASRRRLNPDGYDKYFGFRVMLSASSPTEITFEQKKPSIEVIKPVVSQFEQSYYGNLVLSNGIEFMRIPAGSFMMGVDADSWDDFHPQHVIDIPYDYWMSRYLITNEQYNDYIKSKWFVNHPVLGWEKKKDHPVVNVSWNMANEYCHWVNNQLKAEFPTGLSLRLPNEAEWEKAARGTGGRLYPWGNRFDETKCNTKESEKGDTTPVTYYFPNGNSPYGCADMAGNVYEWTCSLYKSYPFNMKNTITRLSNNDEIALRGGSYDLDLVAAYSIFRLGMDPIKGWRSCGFRVLLAPTLNRF